MRVGDVPSRRLVLLAAVAALLVGLPSYRPASAQMGSGATVRRFLDALDGGDLDTVMATWAVDGEVELADGTKFVGAAQLRAYFETFPRPIAVGTTLAWGGQRYEARITANGAPLLLSFLGANGVIAAMYVEPDPDAPATPPAPTAACGASAATP